MSFCSIHLLFISTPNRPHHTFPTGTICRRTSISNIKQIRYNRNHGICPHTQSISANKDHVTLKKDGKTCLPVRKAQDCTLCDTRQHSMHNSNKRSRLALFSKLNIFDLSEAWFAREYKIVKQANKSRIFDVDRERFGFVTTRFCQQHPGVSAWLRATSINFAPQQPYWPWQPNEG